MNGGLPVARLFGIEIRVTLSLAVMAGIVALIGADQAGLVTPDLAAPLQWLAGAVVAAVYLISVLVHELAHALVGRRRGVATSTIVLGLLGGLAPLSIEAERARDELAIAAAGPLASLAIAVAFLLAGTALDIAGSDAAAPAAGTLLVAGVLNLMLGAASLLPGLPLDGGRIVRAIAWMATGDRDRAAGIAGRFGRLLGWAIVVVGVAVVIVSDGVLGLLLIAMGWLLGGASRGLEQRAELERLLRGVTVEDAMVRDVPHVGPGLTVDTFADRLGSGGAPRAMPVLDGERVLGVVGLGALRRLGPARLATARAGDVMATPPQAPIVDPADAIWGVLETMQRRGLDGLAVVRDGHLLGMITRESAADAVRSRLPAPGMWPGRGGRRS